mgnify:CR=1 FL=1
MGRKKQLLSVDKANVLETSRLWREVTQRIVGAAGVNAEVIFFDPSDGLMVTRFIGGAATMNAELFKDLGAVARAGPSARSADWTFQYVGLRFARL